MRNGIIAGLVLLAASHLGAEAQTPRPPQPSSALDALQSPWLPPNTELMPRPQVGPRGYPYYGTLEYILWWSEMDRAVPPIGGQSAGYSGAVPLDGVTGFPALMNHGMRGFFGIWLSEGQDLGLELGGFWVGERSPTAWSSLDGISAQSELVSKIYGGEAIIRAELCRGTWAHLDFLTGFRYLGLEEALAFTVSEDAAGLATWDRFGARNRFYGGQLGAETAFHYQQYFANIWGKAALGANCQTITIDGATLANGQSATGGLATPAILGRHSRSEFAVVPEFGVNVGSQITQHFRFFAGYTFTYLSEAARPGEQINALVGAAATNPFPFQSADFWIQGLNVGLEFRF